MQDQGIPLLENRPQQNQAAARAAPRPQQPRQGLPAQQRAPQARVATLSFIDSAIASKLALNTAKMHVPLVVASPMGKFVETDKVCRACPITLVNFEVTVDLIVMPVRQFNVILGMDWLTLVRVVMDCCDKIITISIPGQFSFTLKGRGRCREFESLQALEKAESVEVTIRRIRAV
ncbi:uncharacterized protein LOC131249735 [Magnolia sinica]|uniref:uncharacterized protein LOC131249735 n=1 Tax=Magnolia sinica TaxID=86752 RepID=UPI0026596F2A|nr:uncharacterized protein LOC131249735 [Magnolia sinica]